MAHREFWSEHGGGHAIMTDPLNVFMGQWSVSRLILDRRGMGRMSFEGIATIDEARFEECGEMQFAGQHSQSRRTYPLTFSDGGVIVQFPDGREFIRLDERPVQHVHHHCGSDSYRGRFFFLSPDAWGEVWQVVGPRKDYKSITRYLRFTAR